MNKPTAKEKIITVYICQICGKETNIRISCPDCGKYICEDCMGNTYFDKWSDYPVDGDKETCKICWDKADVTQKEQELRIHNDFKANASLLFRVECLEKILNVTYKKDGLQYFGNGGYLDAKYPSKKENIRN